MNEYKQLKIIINLYNQSVKILLPSAKFVIIVPTVFAAYAVVRLARLPIAKVDRFHRKWS